jgi:hypothetical protein
VNLHPVRYIPSQGRLSYFKRIKLTITTVPAKDKAISKTFQKGSSSLWSPRFRGLFKDQDRVRSRVHNPEVLCYHPLSVTPLSKSDGIYPASSKLDPSLNYNYVIITSSGLKSTFQTLADWKISRGINTKVVDVESILAEPAYKGIDDQETIRNFIIDAYNNWG